MSSTVYLVTGTNRGLGLGFVKTLAQREGVIVFATVRDLTKAKDLEEISAKYSGKVYIIKLSACDEGEHAAAVQYIQNTTGRLDVVISNAGISNNFSNVLNTTAQNLREHFEVNTVENLVLFQHTYALLRASPIAKFIAVSSTIGSITLGPTAAKLPAYGVSKAATNYLVRKIHSDCTDLTAWVFCPGGVNTEMAAVTFAADPTLAEKYPLRDPEETAQLLLAQADGATRETHGGRFWSWDKTEIPW